MLFRSTFLGFLKFTLCWKEIFKNPSSAGAFSSDRGRVFNQLCWFWGVFGGFYNSLWGTVMGFPLRVFRPSFLNDILPAFYCRDVCRNRSFFCEKWKNWRHVCRNRAKSCVLKWQSDWARVFFFGNCYLRTSVSLLQFFFRFFAAQTELGCFVIFLLFFFRFFKKSTKTRALSEVKIALFAILCR